MSVTDIATFDFDGTLLNGGSIFPFLEAVAGRPAVYGALATLLPDVAVAAVASGEKADRTKERLFVRVLAGVEAARLADVSDDFARRHLARRLRADVKRRFDWHRTRGDRVFVVSASPECYVAAAATRLGADSAAGTRLEVDGSGMLTGRYDGANCRGAEKLRRIDDWVEATGGRRQGDRLWAYGNSRGDLRMLGAADIGVNVGRLGPIGRLRDFPTLHTVTAGA